MIFSYLKIEVHKDDHFLQSKNKKQQIKMDVRKRFYFCMIENLKLSAIVFDVCSILNEIDNLIIYTSSTVL